jgi:hypothetical protein
MYPNEVLCNGHYAVVDGGSSQPAGCDVCDDNPLRLEEAVIMRILVDYMWYFPDIFWLPHGCKPLLDHLGRPRECSDHVCPVL